MMFLTLLNIALMRLIDSFCFPRVDPFHAGHFLKRDSDIGRTALTPIAGSMPDVQHSMSQSSGNELA
jgi:hypothetical protein